MTTIQQTKNLAAPLLALHVDLALLGRTIILTPVHHFVRFVHIDRTSSGDEFRPFWNATCLFHAYKFWPINYRRELRFNRSQYWLWDRDGVIEDFRIAVEEEALPKLNPIKTLPDFVHFALWENRNPLFDYRYGEFLYSLALGELDGAAEIYRDAPDKPIFKILDRRRDGLSSRIRSLGDKLDWDDRRAIAAYLHDNEAQSVKNLRLEKIWERTPFPIEVE